MKVLITGSTGLLGSSLLRNAPDKIKLFATYNNVTLVPNVKSHYVRVDIRKKANVEKAFEEIQPDIVIHTAAIASPDYCDKHKKEATDVNVIGTKNIIEACRKYSAVLVYITTNGIFDGDNAPYNETSQINPIDHYGMTKFKAEQMVRMSGLDFIIFRLITMYGWNNPQERQNPVTWLYEVLGKNKLTVNMVKDMKNNFLYVEEASKAIWTGVLRNKIGETYHVAGKDCISRYSFSRKIAKIFGLDEKMIFPVTLDFFVNFVPRPKNTCFVTTKMQTDLGITPIEAIKGLMHMKKHVLEKTAWKQVV